MRTELIPTTIPPPMSRHPRTPGIHLSAVIRCIATEAGLLKRNVADDLSLVEVGGNEEWWGRLSEPDRLRISIGLAWEEWYIPQMGYINDHPGEMQLDGIYMTPDGESLDVVLNHHMLCLHEVKATYKSTKTVGNLDSQWMWLAQTKAYCKAMGTMRAFLHVLFLCGDYSFPMTPQLRVWRIDYDQAELDENWETMTGYVRYRQIADREDDAGLEGR